MNKTRMIILLLILVTAVLVFGLIQARNDAKMVFNLPAKFVSLDKAIASSQGSLRYVFWESQISFLNSKNINIYQTNIKNGDFIVKYKGEYYISESKYNELIEIATNNKE